MTSKPSPAPTLELFGLPFESDGGMYVDWGERGEPCAQAMAKFVGERGEFGDWDLPEENERERAREIARKVEGDET